MTKSAKKLHRYFKFWVFLCFQQPRYYKTVYNHKRILILYYAFVECLTCIKCCLVVQN